MSACYSCQRKAEKGGDAVASLTDDNAVLAGIASTHYCDIHTTRYKIASSAILVPLRFYPSESVLLKGKLPDRSRRVRNAKSRMAWRRTEPEAKGRGRAARQGYAHPFTEPIMIPLTKCFCTSG